MIDPKGMVEILTSLYDSHDKWKYKTSGEGHDYLYNVCLNCFFVTTPKYLTNNLPEEAIGGGFTSRFVMVSGTERYKLVAIPPKPPPRLYRHLAEDLTKIAQTTGPFEWEDGAEERFKKWYHTIPGMLKNVVDDRVHPFHHRRICRPRSSDFRHRSASFVVERHPERQPQLGRAILSHQSAF